eukprot:jgi/Galph1/3440/GphlegSOOS_G2078.1
MSYKATSVTESGQNEPFYGHKLRMSEELVSWKRLFLIAIGLCGVQFCWAIQTGNTTKTLLELGLPANLVSMVWLAGPLAGIIVQPIAGILSDKYETAIGKRTPYIVGGSMLASLSLLLFGNAENLGSWLATPDASESEKRRWFGLVIAICSFWLLDFSLNAVQGPLRALMADIAPGKQQEQGNAFFALMTGIGNFLGNLFGSISLSRYIPLFTSDISALYSLGAVIICMTSFICIIGSRERDNVSLTVEAMNHYLTFPMTDDDTNELLNSNIFINEQETNYHSTFHWNIKNIFRIAPTPFWRLFTIQCFTWFAWFTEFVFVASWIGSEVLQGSPDVDENSEGREVFDYGVRMGNLGLSLQSFVSILYSLVLPNLIKIFGVNSCYLFAQMLQGLCLCSTFFLSRLHTLTFSVVCIMCLGIPWSTTMTLPWAIMSRTIRQHIPDKIGMYSTIFNLSQCFPEILVSITAERIMKETNQQSLVLTMGGILALIGAGLIRFIL